MTVHEYSKEIVEKFKKLPIISKAFVTKKPSEKEDKFLREEGVYEFINLEQPGLLIKFPYGNAKCKHTFTLMHGGRYKLPRFIARHIDSRCTPLWGRKPDGSGIMQKEFKGTNPRFSMREVYEQ